MKKILVVHNKYQNIGGEDANIFDEIDQLKLSYQVEYIEYDNSIKLNIFDLIGFFTKNNLLSNLRLKKKLKNFQPNIVYIHNTWFKANLGIFKILKSNEAKVYLKLHNFRYNCSRFFLASNHVESENFCKACNFKNENKYFNKYYDNSYLKSFFLILYSKKLFKIIQSSEIKILLITDFHKEFLNKLGVDSSKLFIYYNPINLPKVNIQKRNLSNYFIYAGRVEYEKGVDMLLETWTKAELKEFSLKIIGSGILLQELKNRFNSKNIEYLGEISNSRVLTEISNARAVVTATMLYEGQPRLLCEASSLGVPSIFPSFGGMIEFFPDNYELSYEQYNYIDLFEKLNILTNDEAVLKSGVEVKEFIDEKLNKNKLKEIFNNIN